MQPHIKGVGRVGCSLFSTWALLRKNVFEINSTYLLNHYKNDSIQKFKMYRGSLIQVRVSEKIEMLFLIHSIHQLYYHFNYFKKGLFGATCDVAEI